MGSRTNVVCAAVVTFKRKEQSGQRLKDGIEKFREALEDDAKALARRRSGLPKDWMSRILK